MLSAKIMVVSSPPNSGSPEDSSKIEPTAAIAAMQDRAKNNPLLGVNILIIQLTVLYTLNTEVVDGKPGFYNRVSL